MRRLYPTKSTKSTPQLGKVFISDICRVRQGAAFSKVSKKKVLYMTLQNAAPTRTLNNSFFDLQACLKKRRRGGKGRKHGIEE
jgi:hypothetical protein